MNSIMFGETHGRALFPMFSLINHSCTANTKHTLYIKNRRIAVQAQTDIRQGEEILINYTSFIVGTLLRRRKIEKNWYFQCECARCADPTELGSHLSSLRCGKCGRPMTQVAPLKQNSPWKCSIHATLYSKAMLLRYELRKYYIFHFLQSFWLNPTINRLFTI